MNRLFYSLLFCIFLIVNGQQVNANEEKVQGMLSEFQEILNVRRNVNYANTSCGESCGRVTETRPERELVWARG